MNRIRIFLSTALIDNTNKPISHQDQRDDLSIEKRMQEYSECFDIIKSLGYEFTIVETVATESKFLEQYSDVIYTNVNNPSYRNRGSNYVNAFKKLMEIHDFMDDDIIIHITGRYPLVDDNFFKICENLEGDMDGCFSRDPYNQFYLFLYAMRFKKLNDLLNSVDIGYLESEGINLEKIFSDKTEDYKIKFIDRLGIIGRQSSSPDGIYNVAVY